MTFLNLDSYYHTVKKSVIYNRNNMLFIPNFNCVLFNLLIESLNYERNFHQNQVKGSINAFSVHTVTYFMIIHNPQRRSCFQKTCLKNS